MAKEEVKLVKVVLSRSYIKNVSRITQYISKELKEILEQGQPVEIPVAIFELMKKHRWLEEVEK